MRVGLIVVMLSAIGFAHEGHHESKAKEVRLTGEVIDITCFVDHDGHGEKHAACAQKCISAGNPVGLLAKDTLYVVVLSSHESPNAQLAPFAGKLVTITGRVTAKNGIHVLDLQTVEAAPL